MNHQEKICDAEDFLIKLVKWFNFIVLEFNGISFCPHLFLQTFVNDVRIPEQTYITLKLEDKLRFGYDILAIKMWCQDTLVLLDVRLSVLTATKNAYIRENLRL